MYRHEFYRDGTKYVQLNLHRNNYQKTNPTVTYDHQLTIEALAESLVGKLIARFTEEL